jgi:hypothetical protein
MHHFDHGCGTDQRGLNSFRGAPTAEENEGRPNAFPRTFEAVLHGATYLRLETAELRTQKPIQLAHLRLKTKEEVGKTGSM